TSRPRTPRSCASTPGTDRPRRPVRWGPRPRCAHATLVPVIALVYFSPQIPGNTGSAIRLAAATGAHLHLVEPLGFDMSEAKLRRAGLDYHDLASVTVHPDLDTALETLPGARGFAFTTRATRAHTELEYADDDVLLFGPEPDGLPDEVLAHPRISAELRIPMLAGRRSLNLTNAASVAVYEAWRQLGFTGAS